MSLAPARIRDHSIGRWHASHARARVAALFLAITGLMTFTGQARAAEPVAGGLMLADTAYVSAADAALADAALADAALPVAAPPVTSTDIGTDSLAGSGIACMIVTLAALASDGGDEKKRKDRQRERTDE